MGEEGAKKVNEAIRIGQFFYESGLHVIVGALLLLAGVLMVIKSVLDRKGK